MTMLMESGLKQRSHVTELTGARELARTEREHDRRVRHVTLVLDPSRLRRMHRDLAARLVRDGIRVTVARGRAPSSTPASVDLLLELERLVYRLSGPRLSDRLDFDQLLLEEPSADDPPDLVIDLCGETSAAPRGRTIRVTYDGMTDESVIIGALVAGRMPTIEIEEAARRPGARCSVRGQCRDHFGRIRMRARQGDHHGDPGGARTRHAGGRTAVAAASR